MLHSFFFFFSIAQVEEEPSLFQVTSYQGLFDLLKLSGNYITVD